MQNVLRKDLTQVNLKKLIMAEKKEKLIKEFLSNNIKVGDKVIVKKKLLYDYSNNPEGNETVTVKEVYDHSIKVSNTENYLDDVVLEDGQYQRSIFHVGANPFPFCHVYGEYHEDN